MTATRNVLNGWQGRRDRREGIRQRLVRRMLIAADGQVVTTRDLLLATHPRLEPGVRVPDWQWTKVRRAAERWAVRVGRRSRPLLWKAKPEALK